MSGNSTTTWIYELKDQVTVGLENITSSAGKADNAFDDLDKQTSRFGRNVLAFNQISTALNNISQELDAAVQPGIDYNASMKDLQAITGTSGKNLEAIGEAARDSAKHFGGDAAKQVESYKILLSKLGPDIAQTPKALSEMGDEVAILSKSMSGDAVGAAKALTTAMNQYSVDLSDPLAASKAMGEMMNVMAAGAKEGSAEVPELTAGLENVGAEAKKARVSFEETNSALQLLDKYGKQGAEGGIALRNVLATLSEGRFLPPETQKQLRLAGVDINKLGDTSISFTDRLRELQKVQGDSALLTKLFGKENSLAATALITNIDAQEQMTKKITGTNSATEQADIVMSSFNEKMSRMSAWFKDLGISIFNVSEPFLPFIHIATSGVQTLAHLGGAAEAVKSLMSTQFGSAMKSAASWTLNLGKSAVLTSWNVLKMGGSMIFAGVAAVGTWITGLITATAAQWGLNIAMTANPIGLFVIGLLAIGAAVAAVIIWWDEIKDALVSFAKFALKLNPFYWIVELIDYIFPGFKKGLTDFFGSILDFFEGLWRKAKEVWNAIKGLFGFGEDSATIEISTKGEVKGQTASGKTATVQGYDANTPFVGSSTGSRSSAPSHEGSPAGGAAVKNIHTVINQLVGKIEVHVNNLPESLTQIRDAVSEALTGSTRDFEAAIGS